jgi:hypothetical protein
MMTIIIIIIIIIIIMIITIIIYIDFRHVCSSFSQYM